MIAVRKRNRSAWAEGSLSPDRGTIDCSLEIVKQPLGQPAYDRQGDDWAIGGAQKSPPTGRQALPKFKARLFPETLVAAGAHQLFAATVLPVCDGAIAIHRSSYLDQ